MRNVPRMATPPINLTALPTAPPAAGAAAQIAQILLKRGLVSDEQLKAAAGAGAAGEARSVLDVLVQQGTVTARDVVAARAAFVGVPFALVTAAMVSAEAAAALPAAFSEQH